MRALVWHGPERMSVDELPDPEPAEGEVLLAPEAVGVCGSELEGYLGLQSNRTPPLVMGHELAGRVVGLGEGVSAGWRDRRVAVNPLVPGADAVAGIEHLSERSELIGVHRPGGSAASSASRSASSESCQREPTHGSEPSPNHSPTAFTPRASGARVWKAVRSRGR